jgi:rubredoxin
MTAEETSTRAAEEEDQPTAEAGDDEQTGRLGEEIDGAERWQDDETVSDKATCPECGEPVHNLRMTCPMCGHEYKDKEIDDDEAGTEFRAGSEIDDDEVGEKVKESQSSHGDGSDDDSD